MIIPWMGKKTIANFRKRCLSAFFPRSRLSLSLLPADILNASEDSSRRQRSLDRDDCIFNRGRCCCCRCCPLNMDCRQSSTTRLLGSKVHLMKCCPTHLFFQMFKTCRIRIINLILKIIIFNILKPKFSFFYFFSFLK